MVAKIKKAPYIPKQGDVVWVALDPTLGHEQKGKRSAVVLSNTKFNESSGLMIAAPFTSQIKGYPFEVRVHSKKVAGVVLITHIRSLDWKARNVSFIESLPKNDIASLREFCELLIS
jgi:mRNA interferase MazF